MVYHHHASYSTAMPYDMPDFSLKKLLCGNEKNARCPGIWWAPKVGRHHGVVCSIMTPLNPLLVDIKHIHKTLRNANGHLEGVGFFKPFLVEILDVIDSGIALCNLPGKFELKAILFCQSLSLNCFIISQTVPSHIQHAVLRTVCIPSLTEVSWTFSQPVKLTLRAFYSVVLWRY